MLRYSINIIEKDFIEVLVILSKEEIAEYRESMEAEDIFFEEKDEYFDLYYYAYEDALFGLSEASNDKWKVHVEVKPKVYFEESKYNKDEVIAVVSFPIIDMNDRIVFPNKNSTKMKKLKLSDEQLDELIDAILINNNYLEKKEIDRYESKCEVYAKSPEFKDILIPSDYFEDENYFNGDLSKIGIGTLIDISNGFKMIPCGEYEISKILKLKAVDLSDEIVKELDFEGTKDILSFKEKVREMYEKILNFNTYLKDGRKMIESLNNISTSLEASNFYDSYLPKGINRLEYIKMSYISNYLNYYLEECDYDISPLKKYLEIEYKLLKLERQIDNDNIEYYFEMRKRDIGLYLILKKGGDLKC